MVSALSDVPLFAGLTPADSAEIARSMTRREFPPHTMIVREGGPGDAAYLVLSGLVAVRRRDRESNVEFVLSELGPGQMFGEMALLTGKTRTATVVALEPTVCAVLSRDDFARALREHPGVAVAFTGILAERLERANEQAGIDFVNLSRVKVDPRVLTLLPMPLINEHKVLPIAFCNNRLTLAMTNPNNVVAFDDVRRILKGVMIEPVVVTGEDFRRFVAQSYTPTAPKPDGSGAKSARPGGPATPAATVDLLQSDLIRELQLTTDTSEAAAETKQDLMSASEDAPIIRLANSILGLAITQGASDIHIEPMEADVTVRYRIDGVLQIVQRLPKRVQLGLISRVKILSRLDIAEKRMPQDGRISVTMEGKPIDFRRVVRTAAYSPRKRTRSPFSPVRAQTLGYTRARLSRLTSRIAMRFASCSVWRYGWWVKIQAWPSSCAMTARSSASSSVARNASSMQMRKVSCRSGVRATETSSGSCGTMATMTEALSPSVCLN